MKIALGDELVTVVKLVKKKVKTEDGETIEMVQVQITDRNLCDAGFKPDRSNAFHLAGRQKVKARIAWFQDHATERMVTVIAEPVKRAADARAKQAEPEAETSIQDKADRDNVLDHFRRVIRIAMGDELVELATTVVTSASHLKRYLAEFDFRYNHRAGLGVVMRCGGKGSGRDSGQKADVSVTPSVGA